MTIRESFRICLMQKYWDFKGRASRSEFWWFALSVLVLSMVASSIFMYILPQPMQAWASLAVSLALAIPNLAVTVRRLHDRNLRGWWVLAPMLSPLLGQTQEAILNVLMLSMTLCFLTLLALPGSKGPNRFGADPLEAGPAAPAAPSRGAAAPQGDRQD